MGITDFANTKSKECQYLNVHYSKRIPHNYGDQINFWMLSLLSTMQYLQSRPAKVLIAVVS